MLKITAQVAISDIWHGLLDEDDGGKAGQYSQHADHLPGGGYCGQLACVTFVSGASGNIKFIFTEFEDSTFENSF